MRRLEALVEAVNAGKLPPRWNADDQDWPGMVGNLPRMRQWLRGQIAWTLKGNVPNTAVISESFGQSPSKAWREAERRGGLPWVAVLHESLMRELDFARYDELLDHESPLAGLRAFAAAFLHRTGAIALAIFPALAGTHFALKHEAWLDRLDKENGHKKRGPKRSHPRRAEDERREPYTVGSLGFVRRDGVVRPQLELLACRLDLLLAPLYSDALMQIARNLPEQDRWTDIADLIKGFRNRNPQIKPGAGKSEFADLTAWHVQVAVQGARRARKRA